MHKLWGTLACGELRGGERYSGEFITPIISLTCVLEIPPSPCTCALTVSFSATHIATISIPQIKLFRYVRNVQWGKTELI